MSSDNGGGKYIEDYPHWKAALFDSEKAVNLRCFLKYCTWHGSYALLAGAILLLSGITKAVNAFPSSRVSASADRAYRSASKPRAKKAARYTFKGVAVLAFLGVVSVLLFAAVFKTMVLLRSIIIGLVTFALVFGGVNGLMWLHEKGVLRDIKNRALAGMGLVGGLLVNNKTKQSATVVVKKGKKAKEKAPNTKGVRRIYGNCPVNLNICPHWFNKYVEKDE